jgi:hypothetical protein
MRKSKFEARRFQRLTHILQLRDLTNHNPFSELFDFFIEMHPIGSRPHSAVAANKQPVMESCKEARGRQEDRSY